MLKFSCSSSRIFLSIFIIFNAFTNEIHANNPIQGFFDDISNFGKWAFGDKNLNDKNAGNQELQNNPATSIEITINHDATKDRENITLKLISNLLTDGLTSNQQNCVGEFKKINNLNGQFDDDLNHFEGLNDENLSKALNQFSGEQFTHFLLANDRTTQQFIRRIYTPLQTVSIDHDCEELRMNKWITWTGLEFGKNFQKGFHGFDMKEINVTATIQKSMNDWLTEGCALSEVVPCDWLNGWTTGLAGTYTYQCYEFNHRSNAHLHNVKGAFYTLLTKPIYYLLFDFILGYSTGEMDRSIKWSRIHKKAHGDLDLYQANFYGELGLNNIFCYDLRIQPFIGIEAGYYHFGDCKEHGADLFDLKINEHSNCIATSYVGLHFFNFQNCDNNWGISADIIWKHLFEFENHLEARFVHFGDKFKICGDHTDLNGLEATLTYFQRINDCWLINAEISGERWSKYSNFYLSLGCSYNW